VDWCSIFGPAPMPRRARLTPEELAVFCEWCQGHSESQVYTLQDLPPGSPLETQFEIRCRHGDCFMLNDEVLMVLIFHQHHRFYWIPPRPRILDIILLDSMLRPCFPSRAPRRLPPRL